MVDTMEKRRRQAVLRKRGLYVLQWADFRVEMMKPRRVEQRFNIIHT
ncbi:MAG: hypothetical protein J6M55_05190 [Paludibacteraceae bacterium]|nr:hypothetical protein [Paludibacteraceae bacterium]